jgi:O-antigen/teichoic acid export membrane protein
MTAFKRIASGSLALWTRMGLSMLAQVLLVPVFLSYWPAKQYGAWLALQSVYSLATILDSAYQTYIENEFLKIGKTNFSHFKTLVFTSLPCVIFIGILQAIIFYGVSQTTIFSKLIGLDNASDDLMLHQCSQVLLIWLLIMVATTSISGILGRALSALGYFSRFAWWGVIHVACSSLLPIIVLMKGGDLLAVGITQAAVIAIYHILWFWDAIRIMRKESVEPVKPSWSVAQISAQSSFFVFLRLLLELGRQHGFRLILAPMVGLKKLAEFSTQRTIAGVATQSLNTIYGPLMPELMRYLREKDQAKTNTIFAFIWALNIFLLGPLVYFLQVLMPIIFPIWTRNKFIFDGFLFMTISASLMAYAVVLPAIAICNGNNFVKLQMYISMAAFALLFASLPITIPLLGLSGAALSLVLAEVISGVCYVWFALNWLRSAGLTWPTSMFNLAGFSLFCTLACCAAIVMWPSATWLISLMFSINFIIMGLRFWNVLPEESQQHIKIHFHQVRERFF